MGYRIISGGFSISSLGFSGFSQYLSYISLVVENIDSGPFGFGFFCSCTGVLNCACVVALLMTGVSGFCSKSTSLLLLGRRDCILSLPSWVSLNGVLPKFLNSEVGGK